MTTSPPFLGRGSFAGVSSKVGPGAEVLLSPTPRRMQRELHPLMAGSRLETLRPLSRRLLDSLKLVSCSPCSHSEPRGDFVLGRHVRDLCSACQMYLQ